MSHSIHSIALEYIEKHFPNCNVAFLAGSSVHQQRTEHSDIDIVIIDNTVDRAYQSCVKFAHHLIEIFVFNHDSLTFSFEISRMEGIATIPRMCAEGWILKDDGSAQMIQERAMELVKEGPPKIKNDKDLQLRYHITDMLLDLDSSLPKEEKIFIAHELFDTLTKYILQVNGNWQGFGKWMYRSLNTYHSETIKKLLEEYITYIQTGNSDGFRDCIDHILEGYGGRVITGYKNFI